MKLKIMITALALSCLFGAGIAQAAYLEIAPDGTDSMSNAESVTFDGYTADYLKSSHSFFGKFSKANYVTLGVKLKEAVDYGFCKVLHRYSDIKLSSGDDIAYGIEIDATTTDMMQTTESDWLSDCFDISELVESAGGSFDEFSFYIVDQSFSAKRKAVTASHELRYIVLFDNKEEAKAYDASVESASIGENEAEIDRVAHTIDLAVEILPGENVEAPQIVVADGAKVAIPEDADFSEPVEVIVTDVTGKEVAYTVNVDVTELIIDDNKKSEIAEALNSATEDTVKDIFEENKSFLVVGNPKLTRVTDIQWPYLYAEIVNCAGTFEADNYVQKLDECVEFAAIKGGMMDAERFEKAVDENSYRVGKNKEYDFWKTLSKDAKEEVLANALEEESYDAFEKAFKDSTFEIAIKYTKNEEELQKVFEQCLQAIGYNDKEYEKLMSDVKNKTAVYYNIYKDIQKGDTDYKELLEKYAEQQQQEEARQKEKNSGGSSSVSRGGGGGVIIRGGLTAEEKKARDEAEKLAREEAERLAREEAEKQDGSFDDFPFADCGSYEWAKGSIKKLYDKNIISGKAEGIFKPGDNVKRAEFVKMILLTKGIEATEFASEFEDVPQSAWYGKFVSTAVKLGIAGGRSKTEFAPEAYITRQDIAVICSRLLDNTETINENLPTDIEEVAEYAQDAVKALYGAGVLGGYEDGTFRPYNLATRAEAAAIISKIYDLIEK